MARSGDHRIRHLARWVATPTLLLAAAAVFYAAYQRDVPILIGAAVVALVAGVIAVVVFDIELIRSRRAHGADRVAQARAYAAMYAAHVRVMAEGFALANPEVQAQRAREAVAAAEGKVAADDALRGTPIVTDTPPVPAARVGEIVDTPPAAVMAAAAPAAAPDKVAASTSPAPEVGRVEAGVTHAGSGGGEAVEDVANAADEPQSPATELLDAPVADQPAATGESSEAGTGEADQSEKWDNREAPTVVDLKAWEIRARVAAEDEREERERQARAADEDAADDTVAESELHTEAGRHPKRTRFRRTKAKARRKGA